MKTPRGYMEYTFHRIIHRVLAVMTACIFSIGLLAGIAVPVQATDNAQKGSLTITPKVGDEVVAESYDGTFSLYLVATGVESGKYVIADGFKDYSGTSITQENLADETIYKSIAQDLAAYVEQRAADGKAVTPDQDGLKAFTQYSLPYGLYLVTQQDKGSVYNTCTPILVMIPAYSVDADGTMHVTENVTAYPKLTKPSTPPDEPHHPRDNPPTTPTHYGKVALGKSDGETGIPLEGVVFNLYKKSGEEWVVIGTYTTDKDGIVYVDHLSYGDYYWQEAQALDGYVLDETPQGFVINSEDLVQLTMINNKIPETPVVPEESGGFTGDSSAMMLYGVVAAAAAVALIAWIIWRRKSQNEAQ